MIALNTIQQVSGGELLNTPQVNAFSTITTRLKNVVHRALFISEDEDEIKEALALGAYGVVTAALSTADGEAAFIKVDSLEKATLKIFRYLLIENKNFLYKSDRITVLLLRTIVRKNNLSAIAEVSHIEDYLQNDTQAAVLSHAIAEQLELACEELICTQNQSVQVKNLFEIVLYGDEVYRVRFCAAFMDELQKALNFVMKNAIPFLPQKLASLSFLEIFSLNARLELTDEGKGASIVLASSYDEVCQKLIRFFEENIKWNRFTYINESNFNRIKEKMRLMKTGFFVVKTPENLSLKENFLNKAINPTLFDI